ncbi:response regulator transcription factor [Cryptosporangium minutisporangium]|uniref:Response regulatory domain-containing protein n=1 Tax=Cryptosporangium minutisporangium TaxID=113569 RepID=A0ABP6T0K4_9ACTN
MALIVTAEDDPDVRELIIALLQREGHTVVGAPDGVSALSEAYAHRPDLMITDNDMPGISGFELCKRLKESAATRHIPVLMISGSLTEAQVEAGLPCVTSSLAKPFRPRVLRERVEALLSSPASERRR